MRIVVIGGSGRVGAKLVSALRHRGHKVLGASPRSGVNTVTGEGLANAVAGSDVVVDVTNPPSFADSAVMEFFQTSCRNLLAAEDAAHVRHHVARSAVGTDRLLASGYFRAKMTQEELIRKSRIPHTLLRTTQFFEFLYPSLERTPKGRPFACRRPTSSPSQPMKLRRRSRISPLGRRATI